MSLPSLSNSDPSLTRDEAINQIISSIAMEELGLSHIINAEGEKLQYALGTLPSVTGPDGSLTVDELLKLNNSVRETLDSTMQNQMLLKTKLQNALSSPAMQGPTGPMGPTGPEGPQGIQGVQGEAGFSGIVVKGDYDPDEEYKTNDYVVSKEGNGFVARVDDPQTAPPSDFVTTEDWAKFVAAGAPGQQGIQGVQGIVGQQGPKGDTGPKGAKGDTGAAGPTGATGQAGATGPTGPQGAPVETHNFNISASGSYGEATIGNVIFRLSHVNNTSISLHIRPASSPVLIDYARSSFFNLLGINYVETQYQDNYTLSTPLGVDTVIYSQSNEQQKSWLRQQNQDGTWSLCEYSIFASRNAARVTLWINWIYKDIAMP